MAAWNPLVSYTHNTVVQSSGVSWRSAVDNNLGNAPESSLGKWFLLGPREQVLDAFHSILETGLNAVVERNSPEPANMVVGDIVFQQVDGEEDAPVKEPNVGVLIHQTSVEVECYVRTPDSDPGPAVNDIVERVRMVVLRERDLGPLGRPRDDRVLGHLLYGTLHDAYGLPHFAGLEEGKTQIEIFREVGTEHGACATVEFFLSYGVRPDNPWILLRPGEGDR